MLAKVKISKDGRLTIPIAIRKQLNLNASRKLTIAIVDDKIEIRVLPTADEWAKLFQNIPTEDVELDENGHYYSDKSPEFHEWMMEDY